MRFLRRFGSWVKPYNSLLKSVAPVVSGEIIRNTRDTLRCNSKRHAKHKLYVSAGGISIENTNDRTDFPCAASNWQTREHRVKKNFERMWKGLFYVFSVNILWDKSLLSCFVYGGHTIAIANRINKIIEKQKILWFKLPHAKWQFDTRQFNNFPLFGREHIGNTGILFLLYIISNRGS